MAAAGNDTGDLDDGYFIPREVPGDFVVNLALDSAAAAPQSDASPAGGIEDSPLDRPRRRLEDRR